MPKLQNLQVGTREVHSMFELQVLPQEDSGLGRGARGLGAGVWPQAANARMAAMRMRMARL